jgi:putative DNA primase/helicase
MPNGEEGTKEVAAKIAEGLLNENHFVTLGSRNPTIYRYDQKEGIYKDNGERYIKRKIEENLPKAEISTHLVNEVLGHVERSTLEEPSIFEESKNPHLVLEDCLFNLETMKTEPFSPEYHSLAKMNVKYDTSIDYKKSKFWKFINEILSHDDVEGVQEELGAILRKEYLTKKFSVYIGPPDTGKTTLLNIIIKFIGEKNVADLSLQQIASKERFFLSCLFGKMANIRDDIPKDIIKTAGSLKEVTGRSRITGEFKFQNPFEFINHAYIIVSCNELPPIEEDDLGVFNRIKRRLFKNRFGGKERPDRELEKKLSTPEELSAILNWALEGLKRLEAQGWNFSHDENETEMREWYKRKSDPLWGFVEDELTDESEGDDEEPFIIKEECYNAFKEYANEKDLMDPGRDYFYKHLPDYVRVRTERKTVPNKGRPWCYVGIKLKPELNKKSSGQDGHFGQQKLSTGQRVQGSPNLSDAFTRLEDSPNGKCSYCGKTAIIASKDKEGNCVCSPCKEESKRPSSAPAR